jgi:hypothetical protein
MPSLSGDFTPGNHGTLLTTTDSIVYYIGVLFILVLTTFGQVVFAIWFFYVQQQISRTAFYLRRIWIWKHELRAERQRLETINSDVLCTHTSANSNQINGQVGSSLESA